MSDEERGATRIVSLWLDNDEWHYRRAQAACRGAVDLDQAAQALRDYVTGEGPGIGEPSLWSDLIQYTLDAVDWSDLAEDFWDAPEDEEDDEDEDDEDGEEEESADGGRVVLVPRDEPGGTTGV